MNRSLLAAALLLAACAPAASAQAPPPAAAHPVLLRLKFTPGQALYYKATLDITSGESTGADLIRAHTRMLMQEKVGGVRASDGAATVEVGVDTMSMTLNGKPDPMARMLLARSKTLGTMVILPNGTVLSFVPPASRRALLALPGADIAHANPLGSMGYFPDVAVKVGDTWVSRIPSDEGAVQPLARFRLSGVDTLGGKRIALIDFTTSGATGTGAASTGVTLKQSVHGTGRLRFDISAGSVADQSSTTRLTMTFSGGPASGGHRGEEKRTLTRVPAPR